MGQSSYAVDEYSPDSKVISIVVCLDQTLFIQQICRLEYFGSETRITLTKYGQLFPSLDSSI